MFAIENMWKMFALDRRVKGWLIDANYDNVSSSNLSVKLRFGADFSAIHSENKRPSYVTIERIRGFASRKKVEQSVMARKTALNNYDIDSRQKSFWRNNDGPGAWLMQSFWLVARVRMQLKILLAGKR